MIEIVEIYPALFPVLFVLIWVGVLLLLSMIGGWLRLGRKFPAKGVFPGKKWHMQSFSMNFVNYGSCATLGANSTHMYMAVMVIFRIGHPNLLIPWSEVEGRESKGLIFRHVNIRFKSVPQIKLKLFKKQADRLEIASNGAWSYVRT